MRTGANSDDINSQFSGPSCQAMSTLNWLEQRDLCPGCKTSQSQNSNNLASGINPSTIMKNQEIE